MDIFSSLSISSYFPFKYLQNDVIESIEPTILLSDNFNKQSRWKALSTSWSKGSETFINDLSSNGINGSTCLWITNFSDDYWVYYHRKKIKVKKGDVFYFEGLVKMTEEASVAWMSLAAFDNNNDAIDWNLFKSKTEKKGEWIKLEKQFDIPDDNIRFIRFRLVGKGNGEFWFDNIIFRKLNYS